MSRAKVVRPHPRLKGLKPKAGVYYKRFRVVTATAGTRGAKAVTHLASHFTGDSSLQQPGDAGRLPPRLPLKMCRWGWHAMTNTKKSLRQWIGVAGKISWQHGTSAIWRVQLYGQVIGPTKDEPKVCARGIQLLYKVPYRSVEGRRLRTKMRGGEKW